MTTGADDHARQQRPHEADDRHRFTVRTSSAVASGIDANWMLVRAWDRLTQVLGVHMAAEEQICYLPMRQSGSVPARWRLGAVADHDDIREAIGENLRRITT